MSSVREGQGNQRGFDLLGRNQTIQAIRGLGADALRLAKLRAGKKRTGKSEYGLK